MKNLEQIRAKSALDAATSDKGKFLGKEGGRAVAKKVPVQILENGFLGALAFAIDAKEGYLEVFAAVLKHLQAAHCSFGLPCDNPQCFMTALVEKDDPVILRAITSEAMAFLKYLRRFAKPDKAPKA